MFYFPFTWTFKTFAGNFWVSAKVYRDGLDYLNLKKLFFEINPDPMNIRFIGSGFTMTNFFPN